MPAFGFSYFLLKNAEKGIIKIVIKLKTIIYVRKYKTF